MNLAISDEACRKCLGNPQTITELVNQASTTALNAHSISVLESPSKPAVMFER